MDLGRLWIDTHGHLGQLGEDVVLIFALAAKQRHVTRPDPDADTDADTDADKDTGTGAGTDTDLSKFNSLVF